MDRDILEELYRKYYAAALLYCTAMTGNESLAQDITADAFVKAYLSLPDDVPTFRYWLLRVCRNLWIDHLRKRQWETSSDPLEYLSQESSPETTYIKEEQLRILWTCIQKLPPMDRELVILHYFSGLSLQETAGILRKSYDATRQRMVRLRKTLRMNMEEQGYDRKL